MLGQRIRGRLAAPPRLAIEVARLARLRRVDAVQSDALAVNLDRVAVDDRGDADDGDCSFTRRDRWARSRALRRRAYLGRSRCYDRGTTGSRKEGRQERRRKPRWTQAGLLRRLDAQQLPLTLLHRPRRARDVARRLKRVEQPRCLGLGDTQQQLSNKRGIGQHVLRQSVNQREDGIVRGRERCHDRRLAHPTRAR
jgi:hypothetical protein